MDRGVQERSPVRERGELLSRADCLEPDAQLRSGKLAFHSKLTVESEQLTL